MNQNHKTKKIFSNNRKLWKTKAFINDLCVVATANTTIAILEQYIDGSVAADSTTMPEQCFYTTFLRSR